MDHWALSVKCHTAEASGQWGSFYTSYNTLYSEWAVYILHYNAAQ